MVISMTGYGRGEASADGVHATVEVRSVNSRFLEVSARLPKTLSAREKELKDLVREEVMRGSLNISVKTEKQTEGTIPLKVNPAAAKSYFRLLNDLRRSVKTTEKVRLEHLLNFPEVFETAAEEESDEREWEVSKEALLTALKDLRRMRRSEGESLERDLRARLDAMTETIGSIERMAATRVPLERTKLQERIAQLVSDPAVINEQRLELEVALLAERIDVTEECVRFRSHLELFRQAMNGKESAGRKFSFIVQEMNREANTVGSKVNDAELQHSVVALKEELERVREQVQNIE